MASSATPPPLLAGWWSGWYWCVTNKNNLSTTMSHHTERYLNKCVASALFMGLQSLPSTLNRFPSSWAHPANSVRNPHLQVVPVPHMQKWKAKAEFANWLHCYTVWIFKTCSSALYWNHKPKYWGLSFSEVVHDVQQDAAIADLSNFCVFLDFCICRFLPWPSSSTSLCQRKSRLK